MARILMLGRGLGGRSGRINDGRRSDSGFRLRVESISRQTAVLTGSRFCFHVLTGCVEDVILMVGSNRLVHIVCFD
jgi:hypothetical protein